MKDGAPRARQLWRRGSGVLAVQVVGIGASVLVPVVLARALGAAGFGVYATVLALVQVLAYLPALGLDVGALRWIPAYSAGEQHGALKGFVGAMGALVLGAATLTGAALCGAALAWGGGLDPELRATAAAGGALLLALPLLNGVVGVLRALRLPVRAQLLDGVLRPGGLALLVGAVLLGSGGAPAADEAMLLHGGVALALAVLGATWAVRALPAGWREAPARYEVRTWLGSSAPMLTTALLQALVRQMDILWVGVLADREQAGLYAVASRLARLVVLGQAASNTIGAPYIAELYARGAHAELGRIARATCLGAVTAGAIVALGLGAAHGPVLSVFGPAFAAAAPVLGILVVGQLVNVSAGPVGYLLNLTGHEGQLTRLTLLLTVTATVAIPLGIEVAGIRGAAIASASVIAARNLGALALVRRHLDVQPSLLGILRRGL